MDLVNDNEVLNKINDEEVMRQIPQVVFMILLCISGIAGNSLVCYIFAKKCSFSTYHIFVTVLSAIDLFTCCIVIPIEVTLQFWQYTFDNKWLCKISSFLNVWTGITSVFLLLCISFERYRKVCTPYSWQLSLRAAKRMCMVSATIGIACSWISLIIYGVQKTEHSVYNITISQCTVTENMKETLFPMASNIVFAFVFVGGLIGIISFYCRIAVRVKQLKKWRYSHKGGIEIRGINIEMTSVSNNTEEERLDETDRPKSEKVVSNDALGTVANTKARELKQAPPETKTDKHLEKRKKSSTKLDSFKSSTNRMSLIMFMVALAFIISYLPVLSLFLYRSVNKTFVANLSDFDRSVYMFCLRSYLLNSVINPVIYGILDPKFRNSCKSVCSCKQV